MSSQPRLIQYWDYLEVPKLLSLQSPFPAPAGPPGEKPEVYDPDADVRTDSADGFSSPEGVPRLSSDELFFISIHQSFELWFQVVLNAMGIARDHLVKAADHVHDEEHLARASYHLERTAATLFHLTRQIELLRTLPSSEFLRMRGRLGTASGFESYQFRLLERHLGLLAAPEDLVLPPPAYRGILAFISTYLDRLERVSEEAGAVKAKVGEGLYAGTALERLGEELGSVAQRRREIHHIQGRIRAERLRPSLKDAWFAWLARRVPRVQPPGGIPSLALLGAIGGVTPRTPIKGILASDGGSEKTRRRERTLRMLCSAHRFEEEFRAGHDQMRSEWLREENDPLHELAAEIRDRQLAAWDEELEPFLEQARLSRDAPCLHGDGEELLDVLGAFPVLDSVIRIWLGLPEVEHVEHDLHADDSSLSVAELRSEVAARSLYGQFPRATMEGIERAFPAVHQPDPESLSGPDLLHAVRRFAAAEVAAAPLSPVRAEEIEFVWRVLLGALRTPLEAAVMPGSGNPRRETRCRYALLYFSRADRIRQLVEDPACVEYPDRASSTHAEASAHAASNLARQIMDRLLDIDEAIANWRAHHVAVIARVLGTRKGTAGTGTEYLARSLGPRGMPELLDGIGRVARPTS